MSSTIENLTTEFLIQHRKTIPYHPQANGTVEVFNNIIERGLMKFCCENREDWDDRVPIVLWAYMMITKKLHKYTPFHLVYVKKDVVPVEFITLVFTWKRLNICHKMNQLHRGLWSCKNLMRPCF
jgi:hypothetical protein